MEAQKAYRGMIDFLMHEFEAEIGKLKDMTAAADAEAAQKYASFIASLRQFQKILRKELLDLVEKEAWERFHLRLKMLEEDVQQACLRVGW